MIAFLRIIKQLLGGNNMLIFLAGLLVGSFTMLLTMSLMVAAKKGDQPVRSI